MEIISDKSTVHTTFKIVLLVRFQPNLKLFVTSRIQALGFFACFYVFGTIWCGSAKITLFD